MDAPSNDSPLTCGAFVTFRLASQAHARSAAPLVSLRNYSCANPSLEVGQSDAYRPPAIAPRKSRDEKISPRYRAKTVGE
jgi:hypothetical protein